MTGPENPRPGGNPRPAKRRRILLEIADGYAEMAHQIVADAKANVLK